VYKKAGCDELKAFLIYDYMHQLEKIAYANDPFDSVDRLAIMDKFSFSAIGNPGIQLRPPYVINHKSLAVNPGSCPGSGHWLTAADINAIICIPQILHYIYADKMHTTTSVTVSTPAIGKLAQNRTRYHIWATGLPSMGTHGAIKHVFDIPYHSNIVTKPNNIIAETLFVMDTFNAALTTVADGGKVNIGTKIIVVVENVCTIYLTLTHTDREMSWLIT